MNAKKTTKQSEQHSQTKSQPQQRATSKPRRLTCKRAEEIVRPIAQLFDCNDEGMRGFIELINGLAYEQDSNHRDLLATAIRLKVFPYTRAYGQAGQTFFGQGKN